MVTSMSYINYTFSVPMICNKILRSIYRYTDIYLDIFLCVLISGHFELGYYAPRYTSTFTTYNVCRKYRYLHNSSKTRKRFLYSRVAIRA